MRLTNLPATFAEDDDFLPSPLASFFFPPRRVSTGKARRIDRGEFNRRDSQAVRRQVHRLRRLARDGE